MSFFRQNLFLIPVIAWIAAVVIKGAYFTLKGKFSMSKALGSGGMPSVHSALVTSLTTAVGVKYGAYHDLFIVCLVFSTIIIYDAINVRFEAGLHARALNELRRENAVLKHESETSGEGEGGSDEKADKAGLDAAHREYSEFNESIGHLPEEAFVGSVVGILTALVLLAF